MITDVSYWNGIDSNHTSKATLQSDKVNSNASPCVEEQAQLASNPEKNKNEDERNISVGKTNRLAQEDDVASLRSADSMSTDLIPVTPDIFTKSNTTGSEEYGCLANNTEQPHPFSNQQLAMKSSPQQYSISHHADTKSVFNVKDISASEVRGGDNSAREENVKIELPSRAGVYEGNDGGGDSVSDSGGDADGDGDSLMNGSISSTCDEYVPSLFEQLPTAETNNKAMLHPDINHKLEEEKGINGELGTMGKGASHGNAEGGTTKERVVESKRIPDEGKEESERIKSKQLGSEFEGMTDEQRRAMLELQLLKLELGYTEEDPPDYDLTERLRLANEELAKDTTPLELERQHSIKFSEKPIVIPPPEFSDDEETDPEKSKIAPMEEVEREKEFAVHKLDRPRSEEVMVNRETEDNFIGTNVPTSKERSSDFEKTDQKNHASEISVKANRSSKGGSKSASGDSKSKSKSKSLVKPSASNREISYNANEKSSSTKSRPATRNGRLEPIERQPRSRQSRDKEHVTSNGQSQDRGDDGETVLVENNGEFSLVSIKDLKSEKQTRNSRPHTANGKPPVKSASVVNHRNSPAIGARRSRSAQPQSCADLNWQFNYTSPYALTPEQRKAMAQVRREEENKKREEKEEKKREEERRQEQRKDDFNAWMRKKQEEARKNRERERKKMEKDDSSDDKRTKPRKKLTRDDWSREKQQQKKEQRIYERKRMEEMNESQYVATEEERDEAFKAWLKKKKVEGARRRKEEKERARIYRLMSRKSRKSMALARAINQAETYGKHVDYYGYRF